MNDEPDEIEALLPWYAADALSPKARADVEAALAARPELRASLATIEEDRAETILLNEAMGAPSPRAWDKVLAGVASSPRRPSFAARLAGWLGAGDAARPERFALAAIAAALLVVLEAGAIVSLLPSAKINSGYATVTVAPKPASGAGLLVTFAPEAAFGDIAAFLKAQQATIVSGPRAGGIFELRVGEKPLTKPELDALVKTFSASPLVKTALPGANN